MKDIIKVVIIGSGLNYHSRIKWEEKTFMFNEVKYLIDPKKLFIVPRNFIVKIKDGLFRRRNVYQIIFKEGDPNAVELPPVSLQDPSSDILYIAERSDALRKGLEDIFRNRILSGKGILFIIIAIGILAVAYLYTTDQLPEIKLPF